MVGAGRLLPPLSAGFFFPQSRSLGIDQRASSPAVVEKIVYAGTACRSFADASQVLHKLANIAADEKQVERLTRALGEERVQERAAEVRAREKITSSISSVCGE